MSAYNGRRGVNVSQYIANLNTIPSPDPLESPPDFDADLALFASNEFVDWDAGAGSFEQNPNPLDINFDQPAQDTTSTGASEPKMDFNLNTSNFEFADFSFPNPIADQPMQSLSHAQPNSYGVTNTFGSPINSAVSPVTPGFDHTTGKKRKLDSVDPTSQQSIDEAARVAAEEDKRRRNTAASARFRVKKKQREQALEKTAKEMSERVSVLETRIQQLETENTWLKGLITEKNGSKTTTLDITALKKLAEENAAERKAGKNTDGVGTKTEVAKA